MNKFHDARDALKTSVNTSPYITPYLGLRSRLSQVWINRWTILLLLVLVRTLFAIADLDNGIKDARREALSACKGLEGMGTAMASMPHYMARGTNELTAHGIEKAVNGLMSMLTMSVTAIEELVVFVINMLTQTYLCLITLVVRGALHAAIELIDDVADFLNKTIGDIGRGIHKGIDGFENGANKVSSGLNKIPAFFGSDDEIPELDVGDSLDKLDNLHLPDGLDSELQKLNKSIPTFSQVNKFTNDAIRLPFEELKKVIKKALPDYKFKHTMFPVPKKDKVELCDGDDGVNGFFDGLTDISATARKVAIAVLLLLATLVCIPMAYREVRRWRMMKQRAQLINEHAYDPLDVMYIVSRPYTATTGIKATQYVNEPRKKTLVRWVIAYATSAPALFVLSLGIAGLFSTFCHYLVLRAVEKEAPALTHEIGDFAEKVVTKLDNASMQWANGTNHVILKANAKINDEVLGWVNVSTKAMNDTLNTFVDETIGVLKKTFGGTILYDPIKEVFNCLIGLKIESIEKGLTWVHNNAHIDFPLLPNNTFSLNNLAEKSQNAKAKDMLHDPHNEATEKVTGAVKHLMKKLYGNIRQEAIISTVVVGIWVLVVLIGIIRALMLAYGPDKTRAEGGGNRFHSEPITMADLDRAHDEKRPSFTPDVVPAPPPHLASNNPFRDPDEKAGQFDNANGDLANAGSEYRGEDYTIKPRGFPEFANWPSPTSPKDQTQRVSPVEEKVGYAGERNVDHATRRQTLLRTSTHPDMTVATSPRFAPRDNDGNKKGGSTFEKLRL
ncbi:MAG: plasma membrane fusion protein prm1 [Alyxoria varia]|nr:MAG: plasma membrane fusion protein prm1 [Alyxoria varia]